MAVARGAGCSAPYRTRLTGRLIDEGPGGKTRRAPPFGVASLKEAGAREHGRLGLLLGLIATAIFAGSLPATKIAVAELSPWFVTAARASLAGLCGLALLVARRRRVPPRAAWLPLSVVAVGAVLGFPLLSALAMESVPAAHGGVVIGLLPLATAFTATLFAHERPRPLFWVASLAGAALVIAFSLRHSESYALDSGDLLLLGAVIAAAVGYTESGKLARVMPGWEVISWACVIALPLFGPALLMLWPANAASVSLPSWAAIAYVGVFSQYIAFFAWNAGLAMGGIARVGQMQLLQPFFTVAIAAVCNDEPVELETLAFAAAVVATVLIGLRARAPARAGKKG